LRKKEEDKFKWKNSGAACNGMEFPYLVSAPETCFNSCLCVFGGMLPQGNIFHFIASNKFNLIFPKLHDKHTWSCAHNKQM